MLSQVYVGARGRPTAECAKVHVATQKCMQSTIRHAHDTHKQRSAWNSPTFCDRPRPHTDSPDTPLH